MALLQALVWFFGRWVDTYLMPADAGRGPNSTPSGHEGEQQLAVASTGQFSGRNALNIAFGENGGGKAVLEVLVRVTLTALTAWPGERSLQAWLQSLIHLKQFLELPHAVSHMIQSDVFHCWMLNHVYLRKSLRSSCYRICLRGETFVRILLRW